MTNVSKSSKIKSEVNGDGSRFVASFGDGRGTGAPSTERSSRDNSPAGSQHVDQDNATCPVFPENSDLKILAIQLASPSVQQDLRDRKILLTNFTIKMEIHILCKACLPKWYPGQDFNSKIQKASKHLTLLDN